MVETFGENYLDLGYDFDEVVLSNAPKDWNQSDCINGCYDKFTDENGNKKPGRGSCKLSCWTTSFMVLAEKFLDVVDIPGIF